MFRDRRTGAFLGLACALCGLYGESKGTQSKYFSHRNELMRGTSESRLFDGKRFYFRERGDIGKIYWVVFPSKVILLEEKDYDGDGDIDFLVSIGGELFNLENRLPKVREDSVE